jgi:hypothetical protein
MLLVIALEAYGRRLLGEKLGTSAKGMPMDNQIDSYLQFHRDGREIKTASMRHRHQEAADQLGMAAPLRHRLDN